MIQLLAGKYQKAVALFFFCIFYGSFCVLPSYGATRKDRDWLCRKKNSSNTLHDLSKNLFLSKTSTNALRADDILTTKLLKSLSANQTQQFFIGGPSQPEMSSFKSVGTDNMVNLFTGDFNYNIPLLDVGGYPVNIFYDGGVGMDQEASWVGLGWNINPGNINRNMRGVPDDFNGNDTLIQEQKMKKNKTWGVNVGADIELIGIKGQIFENFSGSVGANLGASFNNYLGPALDFSVKGSTSYQIAGKTTSEKGSATKIGGSLAVAINSRSGVTFSPSVSLTASASQKHSSTSFGLGLSTGYNSRSGIKALQISEQVSFSSSEKAKNGWSKNYASIGHSIFSSSISFAKPSYIPAIRMPLTNTAFAGHFQLGGALFGVEGDVEAEVYKQTSEVSDADVLQRKPLVGYLYYQNAVNNPNAILDFTRFNDKEVTPNTPVISAPQYSYDVFSIQGEGTGGSIRAYRNDLGYVRDNVTQSKDKNISVGVDIGIPGHVGGNFSMINTPSTIGEWGNGNKLRSTIPFTKAANAWENVYFRNPGENSVLSANQFNKIGGVDLVRFQLGGSASNPTIEPAIQRFDQFGKPTSTVNLATTTDQVERKKRTQVTSFLTAEEASKVGLDIAVKNYNSRTILDNATDTLLYESISRNSGYRKSHHISQINVTEANGKRYVYGIPVYNTIQKDFTFSVGNTVPADAEKIKVDSSWMKTNSPLLNDKSSKDGYIQVTTTPAYAHSFLLSGLLSPDYVDVTGNGITEDDLGDAVKFNYNQVKSGSTAYLHKWRTPLTNNDSANFNPGNRSEIKDDKAIVSYGERESWYLHSVESKTMIAIFYVSNRKDGKGATAWFGGIDVNDTSHKKLDSIALYSKADLKANGLAKAKPIKTVHFNYSYTLCQHTPDNPGGNGTGQFGKLTLESIYFTFNGKSRVNKNRYVFSYGNTASQIDNPNYAFASSDRWGNYKPKSMNPSGLKNGDYPYAIQDTLKQTAINQNASAWMLKKILLPSGGQIEVAYESDDYAFVQDKRATDMLRVIGFGTSPTSKSNRLYNNSGTAYSENNYVFIRVPNACTSKVDAYNKYLQGISQLAFKIWVNMPKGAEYLTSYASISDYGLTTDANVIWIKMAEVNGRSPLAITALEYLREQLPGQAFTGYDVSDDAGLAQVGDMLMGMLTALRDAFKDPVNALREDGKAMYVDTTKCFVRLNDPDGFKYGGGYRVKSVTLKDNWKAMTGQYTSSYGQLYDYTTTETFNGSERKISSGVASYEPSIGGEENPFQTIIQIEDKLPLGPASFGSVEMPILDAFFPSPSVGYSKVTVRSLKSALDTSVLKKWRSGIGKQVSEFYTAKDYPTYYSNTSFDALSSKEFHQSSMLAFFYKYAYDYKALSQGFLVATNDMHGKMKSQSSYAENDTATRINYTENFYRNTGNKGLNETFDFVDNASGGTINPGNMGIDVELMTDTREFSVKSSSTEIQAQADLFPIILPFWIPTVWPVKGVSENIYRAVTTTKVISYHAVLDSVVVIDKGSLVSTKNLVYDAQTGEVVVNRTNNEFKQAVYTTSYPAYWAYSGMGLAYKNIDAVFSGVNFSNGRITNTNIDQSIFESGDELLVLSPGAASGNCAPPNQPAFGNTNILWAFDTTKNTSSLTSSSPYMVFMDASGNLCNQSNLSFRIIRSGHRNMLDAKVSGATSMVSPFVTVSGSNKLLLTSTSKVTNASASEFKEKWQTDKGIIKKKSLDLCSNTEYDDCNGYLEKTINPYRKGLLGNFRPNRSLVFYGNRTESNPLIETNISQNGFLANFNSYWTFNTNYNLVPNNTNNQWVWNSQLTKVNAKGLELETQNALNIFTAAQYGYNKTMPVAITNNARYSESFYEGFEDNAYNESLNKIINTGCVDNKFISFSDLGNIKNTDSLSFSAHTGRNVLEIPNNSSLIKTLNIASSNVENFNSVLVRDTIKVLTDLGGNTDFVEYIPSNSGTISTTSFNAFNSFGFHLQAYHYGAVLSNNSIAPVAYQITNSQIVEIATNGNYTFSIQGSYLHNDSDPLFYGVYSYITVKNLDGNIVAGGIYDKTGYISTTQNKTYSLCKGVYKIEVTIIRAYSSYLPALFPAETPYPYENYVSDVDDIIFQCTSHLLTGYKSLTKDDNCIFIKPLAATDSMLNPIFSPSANKKMVFSAWVHEEGSKKTSYDSNQVVINDGIQSFTMKPSGPVIDGWQRYEGVFTPATSATALTLSVQNSSYKPIYFDDIRIHPFNANMKSYVYDPINLRLVAELDANNYASFYEYDEEGTLVRTKAETREGIKTIKETRSAKQKAINSLQ